MSIIINVNDSLAQRLQTEAKQRRVSVEELAINILDAAVPVQPTGNDWGQRNQRRLELIRKSMNETLNGDEQAELDALQRWLDAAFESFDAGLLQQLDEMKTGAQRLLAEQSGE